MATAEGQLRRRCGVIRRIGRLSPLADKPCLGFMGDVHTNERPIALSPT